MIPERSALEECDLVLVAFATEAFLTSRRAKQKLAGIRKGWSSSDSGQYPRDRVELLSPADVTVSPARTH